MRRAQRVPRLPRPALAAAIILLVATLASCTVYLTDGETSVRTSVRGRISFGIPLDPIIHRFAPTRGEGSTYRVGEEIAFTVQTSADGYITLTAIDPDGLVYTFARNLFVRGGQVTTISGPSSREVFTIEPPRGLQRVRASFTPSRTDTSRVTYRGRRGEEAWTQGIVVELRDFPTRDVAETYFYIR